ncbi:putative CAAX prenyl protease 1 [Helianthus annuus]|nr:putative CAAX prenyl protease 1 [Helianthus annuus]
MAIASIPSFNLTAKSSPLCFNFHITGTKPLFTSSYAKFGSLKKNPIQISVCKAVVSSSLSFRDLDADDFRHPLDKQNTLLLKAIPGLNEIGKALLGCVSVSCKNYIVLVAFSVFLICFRTEIVIGYKV